MFDRALARNNVAELGGRFYIELLMDNVALQFQGVRSAQLVVSLLAAVAAVLLAWGVWQLIRRRWRSGVLAVAAAMGPAVMVPALVVDAARRFGRGDRRGGRMSCLAAAAATAAVGAAALFVLSSGRSGSALWMSLLGIEVALAVGVFYTAVYAYLGPGRMSVLMAMRCAAILALLLVLFKPALSVTGGDEGLKPYLPILVDRSASMATSDEAGVPSRYLQAVHMLSSQQARVRKFARPVWIHFASSVQTVDSLDGLGRLSPSGAGAEATNIAAAIRHAGGQFDQGSLAGIVLLSDGNHNAPDKVADAVTECGVPIYAVGLGSANESAAGRRNIQIVSVDAPMEAVKNNVATLTAKVRVTGFANVTSELRLLEEGVEQPLDAQRLFTDKNSDTLTIELKWTPKDAPAGGGKLRKLRVVVPPGAAEATADDNQADVHVLVAEPRLRVLYVEGTIRPEYKFLKRYLDSDPNVQYVGLVRINKNEFLSQGGIGGKRLTALPRGDEDFAMFDVIILGDLDRSFLSDDQIARVRRFVNDGGGLLMLGGHNSFGPGGYGGTEIETALPVTMGTRSQPQESTPLVPQLTAAGEGHPIFEGIAGFFGGPGGRAPKADLPKLPELLGCVTVAAAKPGASVLALHPTRGNDGGPLIVLAVQQFGAGRSAAFTADTTERWYMPMRGLGAESPYQRFWGQMIRWLANQQSKARNQAPAAALRLERPLTEIGQTLRLTARVLDDKGAAADSARVTCAVTCDDASVQPENLSLTAGGTAGVFETTWRPAKAGKYTLKLSSADASGKPLGADELTTVVASHQAEMDHLARNVPLLRTIAESSGGRYADISGLPDLVDQIIERQKGRAAPTPQAEIYHLYNFTLLFLAFVALLTGEWLLRRKWQLQ